MRLFSKKAKAKQTAEPKKEIDIQECFKQNLKYISQTEINAEDIQRQFVKSDSRYYLTVGQVDCPAGQVVVSDPLCYLASGHYCPTLAATIPPGSYPVEVSIYRNSFVGIRMCTARLKVKTTKAEKYICAEPTKETAAGECSDGILTGFPVDAGMMCFCDAQEADAYRRFLDKWHKENEGKNHYDDYFAGFFAESEKAFPAYQREGGDFIEWENPDSGKRLVMIASGFGDGFYQSFWGYDKDNEICELIVPMVNPDLFE